MRKTLTHAIALGLALMLAPPALADGPGDAGPDVAAPPVRTAPAPATAEPAAAQGRTGLISLDGVMVTVPDGYRFYSAEEAYGFLQRNNAAAPQGAVLGLIARANANIRQPGTWATVVSYDAIGYVQPETASGLTAASFETDVRTARTQQNRTFEGFAATPAFATEAPSLVWAERAAAPGSQGPDLRFEQKSLGRYGVACLTSVGSADQLPDIQASADELRAMLTFPTGAQHTDFQPATDQVSAYSVPGLVTGVPTPQPQAVAASTEGQTGFGGLAGWFPWVAIGVILLAIAGYLMMRRNRDENFDPR